MFIVEREFTVEFHPEYEKMLVGRVDGAGCDTLQYSILLLF
jgi:hypothetical protein